MTAPPGDERALALVGRRLAGRRAFRGPLRRGGDPAGACHRARNSATVVRSRAGAAETLQLAGRCEVAKSIPSRWRQRDLRPSQLPTGLLSR
jgi:hypothetical protein